jgi:hypothetical protein
VLHARSKGAEDVGRQTPGFEQSLKSADLAIVALAVSSRGSASSTGETRGATAAADPGRRRLGQGLLLGAGDPGSRSHGGRYLRPHGGHGRGYRVGRRATSVVIAAAAAAVRQRVAARHHEATANGADDQATGNHATLRCRLPGS